MPSQPIRVLLIEDHPADIQLTRKAFGRLATPNVLDVVFDGIEAMRFLRREGRYTQAIRPDIILLDLHMPRADGREVLREIDADPTLHSIPVIVFTTSAALTDVRDAYTLRANSYLPKPTGKAEFMALVELIEKYWFLAAALP